MVETEQPVRDRMISASKGFFDTSDLVAAGALAGMLCGAFDALRVADHGVGSFASSVAVFAFSVTVFAILAATGAACIALAIRLSSRPWRSAPVTSTSGSLAAGLAWFVVTCLLRV